MIDYKIRIYERAKVFMPRSLQILLRRKLVKRQLARSASVWPIFEPAKKPPPGWTGWPDRKKFAFVLTHDVDSQKGLDNCLKLAEIEERLGFRSSFNFVAYKYGVPPSIRDELTARGFEVGLHGLYHDSKLYRSREDFLRQAPEINKVLKEWNAAGFRSPCMYHNLRWMHDLDIEYDASTFDTDPFEPQPHGLYNIFPFFVPDGERSVVGQAGVKRVGYVELPYTLPQDFTLFILMQNRTIDIWKKKLDWLVRNGGMALLNTHPDYMSFNGRIDPYSEYDVNLYRDFLQYLKTVYADQYWHPLPREIGRFWRKQSLAKKGRKDEPAINRAASPLKRTEIKGRLWIDLDNSPHVPLFRPIIDSLEKKGFEILLTARHCSQVCELADKFEMKYLLIGRHHGEHRPIKLAGLFVRACELFPVVSKVNPALALSHGSRAQLITANLLRIPSIEMTDYEHTQDVPLIGTSKYLIVPEVLKNHYIDRRSNGLLTYPGIKEDVYIPFFKPDESIVDDLGLGSEDIIITIRPPAMDAHYFRPESGKLFEDAMEYLGSLKKVKMVMLPRNDKQRVFIQNGWPELLSSRKMIIPPKVVDGLNLIWFSDLVISGGGTMNREAAALGVPVYSIFRGKIGAVDQYLSDNSRLVLIENSSDLRTKIRMTRRRRPKSPSSIRKKALDTLVNHVISIFENLSMPQRVK